MIDEKMIEIREYSQPGYRPLVDYGAWRVAVLNFIDELLPERIDRFQRHDETDEVFILLAGRTILFVGDDPNRIGQIHAIDMEPGKVYNIKKGYWHSHTLNEAARLVIIENRDTQDYVNSPYLDLDPAQRQRICDLTRTLWA